MDEIIRFVEEEMSPDKIKDVHVGDMVDLMVDSGVLDSEQDAILLLREAVERAVMDGDEFPIHYYPPEEPMSEEGRIVEDVECLTDDFIENELSGK